VNIEPEENSLIGFNFQKLVVLFYSGLSLCLFYLILNCRKVCIHALFDDCSLPALSRQVHTTWISNWHLLIPDLIRTVISNLILEYLWLTGPYLKILC